MPKFSKSQIRYAASKPRKKQVEQVQSTPQQVDRERAATRKKFASLLQDYQKAKGSSDDSSLDPDILKLDKHADIPRRSDNQPHESLSSEVARDIEENLFNKHGNTKNHYREDFRKLFFALKNFDNYIQRGLLNGTISGQELVHMSAEELSSEEQRKQNEKLQQENMRLSTRNAADLPETIKALDDGRVGEKWWGGSSHAAIDD